MLVDPIRKILQIHLANGPAFGCLEKHGRWTMFVNVTTTCTHVCAYDIAKTQCIVWSQHIKDHGPEITTWSFNKSITEKDRQDIHLFIQQWKQPGMYPGHSEIHEIIQCLERIIAKKQDDYNSAKILLAQYAWGMITQKDPRFTAIDTILNIPRQPSIEDLRKVLTIVQKQYIAPILLDIPMQLDQS